MTDAEVEARIEAAWALEVARGGAVSRAMRNAPAFAVLIKEFWINGYITGYVQGLDRGTEINDEAIKQLWELMR